MKVELINAETLKKLQTVAEYLRHPVRLRVATLSILAIMLAIVYDQQSTTLDKLGRQYRMRSEKKELIGDLDLLKASIERLGPHLPASDADVSWWLSQMRTGAAKIGVQLANLKYSPSTATVGDYAVLDLNLDISATNDQFVSCVSWLESMTPKIRVESISLHIAKPTEDQVQAKVNAKVLLGR